jgi:hypothetical protein
MEKWLEDFITQVKAEGEKELLAELKDKPLNFSMKIEAGTTIADINVDVKGLLENVVLPTKLFKLGFDGIENALKNLDMPLQKDYKIKGYSESEYKIPFYLEDEKRLVLFEPMMLSGIMELLGLGDLAYTIFSPFLAIDFFKYIDIMNAQSKPTIMAFIGLTDFKEVTNVNFLDFLKSMMPQPQSKSENKATGDKKPVENTFEFLPRNVFNIYGIPDFKIPLSDGIRLSRYDASKTLEQRKIKAYGHSIGIDGFLNPNIVDYAIFTANMAGKASLKTMSDIMHGGEALGHSPSKSRLVPDARPVEVIDDPLILLSELKKQGMVTEMAGKFELTISGFKMVNAEVKGKPKETTLSKVWNVVKKAKEVLPFLKFLS